MLAKSSSHQSYAPSTPEPRACKHSINPCWSNEWICVDAASSFIPGWLLLSLPLVLHPSSKPQNHSPPPTPPRHSQSFFKNINLDHVISLFKNFADLPLPKIKFRLHSASLLSVIF